MLDFVDYYNDFVFYREWGGSKWVILRKYAKIIIWDDLLFILLVILFVLIRLYSR